jgi:hypothetical protein
MPFLEGRMREIIGTMTIEDNGRGRADLKKFLKDKIDPKPKPGK